MDFSAYYTELFLLLQQEGLSGWKVALRNWLEQRMTSRNWGDLPDNLRALETIVATTVHEPCVVVREGVVHVGRDIHQGQGAFEQSVVGRDKADSSTADMTLSEALRVLMPWRKGPFCIQGVHIDTEWRSCLKWDRLSAALGSLQGARVLDVGCGNGYSMWRAYADGAALVLGIDPTPRYILQYLACYHFAQNVPVGVMPAVDDDLSELSPGEFNVVFSMGVYYHRRDPVAHFRILHRHTAALGKVVIEGLVVDASYAHDGVFHPEGRYAKMRNVFALPTVQRLCAWVEEAGFHNAQVVDVSVTTTHEQRRSAWMNYESLPEFLDAQNPTKTVEGHPAPLRAIVIAET